MIARIWRGTVRATDADTYGDYIAETGLAEYEQTPGNRGAWLLRRDAGELTEYMAFTLWESLDALKAFAGDDYETAVYYPNDDRYLVERDATCAHYDVRGST